MKNFLNRKYILIAVIALLITGGGAAAAVTMLKQPKAAKEGPETNQVSDQTQTQKDQPTSQPTPQVAGSATTTPDAPKTVKTTTATQTTTSPAPAQPTPPTTPPANPPTTPNPSNNVPTPNPSGTHNPPAGFGCSSTATSINVVAGTTSSTYKFMTSDGSNVRWQAFYKNMIWADGSNGSPSAPYWMVVHHNPGVYVGSQISFEIKAAAGSPTVGEVGMLIEDGSRNIMEICSLTVNITN